MPEPGRETTRRIETFGSVHRRVHSHRQPNRLDVLGAILASGVVPLFYSPDAGLATEIGLACREGGTRAVEFTDRGPEPWRPSPR